MTGDGVEALAAAERTVFDLVITDLNMPNMDGVGLIEQLRETPRYRSRPINVATTESANLKPQRAKAAGATGDLVKPFEPARSVRAVERCVRRVEA